MTDTVKAHDPSRRSLLKLGLVGGALLATVGGIASLSSDGDDQPAPGYLALRAADLPFLQTLIPVILDQALTGERLIVVMPQVLRDIDLGLASVSPALLSQIRELFDVTSSRLTRGPLTGVWQPWQETAPGQVAEFLQRWRDSSLALLRQGHAALLQMVLMAWYGNPDAWAHCGYPGPPTI